MAGVFGLIAWQSPSPGLALPIFFNNNNNNNSGFYVIMDGFSEDFFICFIAIRILVSIVNRYVLGFYGGGIGCN